MDFGKTLNSHKDSNSNISKNKKSEKSLIIKNQKSLIIKLEMKNSILEKKILRQKKIIENFEKKEALNFKFDDIITKNINKLKKNTKIKFFGFFEKDLEFFGNFENYDFGEKSVFKGLFVKLIAFLKTLDYDNNILNTKNLKNLEFFEKMQKSENSKKEIFLKNKNFFSQKKKKKF